MCVIVVKPSNIDMPSESVLRACFVSNPDGAGYMYRQKDGIHIKKGFMFFKDFYENLTKDYEEQGNNVAFVMHFRIGTMGSRTAELTHPYPISKELEDLKKLEFVSPIAMAHNGIISLTNKRTENVDRNDSMAFVTDYLALFMKDKEDFEDEDKMQVIKQLVGNSNKLAFLTDKKIYLVGEFYKDESTGCYFSNTYWKWRVNSNYSYGYYYDGYSSYGNGDVSKKAKSTDEKKDERQEEKDEKQEENAVIKGQISIDEEIEEMDEIILEEYYDSCYNPQTGLYTFVEDNCPFTFEEDTNYCDNTVCANTATCPYYKKIQEERNRKLIQFNKDRQQNN